MSRRKGRDGLVSKIMHFTPLKDNDGEFIPYCSYSKHPGLSLRPATCETRNCKHYRKLYIDGIGRVDEASNYDGEYCQR
jgi:hypothetical protein